MKRSTLSAILIATLLAVFLVNCGDEDPNTTGNDDIAGGDEDTTGDEGNTLPDNGTESPLPTDNDTPVTEGGGDYPPDTDDMNQWNEMDDDGDGIKNGHEGTGDTDGDGTPDYLDDDSDGDGIPDSVEAPNGIPVDTDKDGTPDFQDTDSDNDGIPDSVECPELPCRDTDGDGVPDYRDTDSDNDGILDSVEAGSDPANPVDTDGDGTPDYRDTDSDNDGIPDSVEGHKDRDGDGTPNYLDTDSDGDGIPDSEECSAQPCPDTDGDGTPDFLDTDSDNDGLSDAKEKELGTNPYNPDSDGDGVDDNTEHAFGSDPNDPNSKIPENAYYYVLPYGDPAVHDILEFSTDIRSADIMIMVDLSGSMGGEHTNLKNGINNTVITGIKAKIPNSAFGLAKFGTLEDKPYALAQGITTDVAAVQTAVNGIAEVGGSSEAAYEALYQAMTGAGGTYDCGSGGCSNITPMAVSTIPASSPGWRTESLAIIIMCTDEELQDYASSCKTHSKAEALASMNAKNAKFIGINSGGGSALTNNFKEISTSTGSLDGNGNPFNYTISSDGTGLSQQVVDAVVALSKGIQIDVNTIRKSVPHPELADTTQFIKAVEPVSGDPANGFETKDGTTFYKVKPGTKVTFDVTFQNDVYDNQSSETQLFVANINVMGAGTLLDTRQVFILVPGKIDTGGED